MIQVVECSLNDVKILAKMNKRLIADEKADNTMDVKQLEQRMVNFLSTEYTAYFFILNGNLIGYALCNRNKAPNYLRQFFIKPKERRKGFGRQAFQALLDHIQTNEVDIDVYVWNETGVAFWNSLGFEKRCFQMRYNKHV